jgi:predicted nuclease of predicted toxin-antitoxin system
MQFLANENFPLDAVEAVRKLGHDVAWIRTEAPGSKDRDILRRAESEQRILLTFDKDFGELAFQASLPVTCGIVLFRLQANSSTALAALVAAALQSRTDWPGQFAVVEAGRIRIRALPASPAP